MTQSEFGKGLVYCLGLFLAHECKFERERHLLGETQSKECGVAFLWFNSARDHLLELDWQSAPKRLQGRLKAFQDKVLNLGVVFNKFDNPTDEDVFWACQEAKDLLRLIDKTNGVSVMKGEWE